LSRLAITSREIAKWIAKLKKWFLLFYISTNDKQPDDLPIISVSVLTTRTWRLDLGDRLKKLLAIVQSQVRRVSSFS